MQAARSVYGQLETLYGLEISRWITSDSLNQSRIMNATAAETMHMRHSIQRKSYLVRAMKTVAESNGSFYFVSMRRGWR